MRRASRRRHRDRVSPLQAGALGIVLIVLISWGAYTKFANPFASHFTVHAVFPSANGLNINSPVRIAGVNVGKVTGIATAPGCHDGSPSTCQASDVTMAVDSNGLPIHEDATFTVRPRIFLEGNFFVDISPGTPSAPIVHSGHTFPVQQGADAVRFDQVLTSLQANTRKNLQILVDQYGAGVFQSSAAFNRSIPYWLPAYRSTGIVTHDALGERPHDLSTLLGAGATVAGALDAQPQSLQNLITDFDTTAFAFARQNAALAQAVAELPGTLATGTPALNALSASLPPLNRLAQALIPGVRATGPAIDVSLPLISQLRQLVAPRELRGLSSDLAVTVPALAKLTRSTIPLMREGVRPVASCVANNIYPWSQLSIDDHTLNGPGIPVRPVYVEAVDYLPGLAGESRVFDANGPYIRVLGTGGTFTYSLQPGLFGQALGPITAVQPQLPPGGKRPPLHSGIPCETQAPVTDLSAPAGPPLKQVATDLSAPGAALRWKSAATSALDLFRTTAKQQGLSVRLPNSLQKALK
jgi:phospholipid/cholesterol/gamma-HCH transport system substrate-binding protein